GAVAWAAWKILLDDEWTKVVVALGVVAAMAALGFVWFAVTRGRLETIAEHRVRLTRWLASALQWVLMLSGLALIDTLGQTLYRYAHEDWTNVVKPAAVTGAVMWLIQNIAKLVDEKKKPDWLAKIPLSLLAGVAGVCLLFVVAMFWALLVQWVQWAGFP